MIRSKSLNKKSFAVYGLGVAGKSVVKFLIKHNVKKIIKWDDNKENRRTQKIKGNLVNFKKKLKHVDYIIVSPGIKLNKKNALTNIFSEYKKKIISDLDLLYFVYPKNKSIMVTGTNGKSTTCKIIDHVLKNNKYDVKLGGNIGKSILDFTPNRKTIFIIEASSFQLAYSRYIKPNYALMLNISNDHLDWHGTRKNYLNAKLKIFKNQNKEDFALIGHKQLQKKLLKKKSKGNIKIVDLNSYKIVKSKIENDYLLSKTNDLNMSFVFKLSKILKIREKKFIKSLKNFKGLPHRHEIFYKKNNIKFINDSKATSFEATRGALESSKNIHWIVGGKPKIGDKLRLNKLSKNITKAYIIGKNINFFKKQIEKKVKVEISKSLKKSLHSIFETIYTNTYQEKTVLLSPASASFDQYENFEIRGNEFKKLVKHYAKKYF
jgi:UDP-N-acetylmuramoylalanine--D-glutamate ligase